MVCPLYKNGLCNVNKENPPKQFDVKFCNKEETEYSKCPLYMFDQIKSSKQFDLRTIDKSLYNDLRKLNSLEIFNEIIRVLTPAISLCKKCAAKQTGSANETNLDPQYDSASKICFEHRLTVHKILYILQEIHGFNQHDKIKFASLPNGPYSEKIKQLLEIDPLKTWAKSKINPLDLQDQDRNLFSRFIDNYKDMNPHELEILSTYHYEHNLEIIKKYGNIIDSIKDKYPEDAKLDFEKEVKLFEKPLLDTLKRLPSFEPDKCLGVGSSGITIKLRVIQSDSKSSPVYRVLKFPRPRGNDFRITNLKIIKEEIDILYSLNSDRIVKVILQGETEYDGKLLPWYIMEYIGPSKNLKDYLESDEINTLTNLDSLINIITDICIGVEYLHRKKIIHCDIKLDNILVKMEDRPVGMLTDLGYSRAKDTGDPDEIISVKFDGINAHPFLKNNTKSSSEPAALTAKIPRKSLDYKFDLYALGMTIKGILDKVEKKFAHDKVGIKLTRSYEFKYLKVAICRLISSGAYPSTEDEAPNVLPSLEGIVRGLNNNVLLELAYQNSHNLLEDLRKLNNMDLESWIPELNEAHPEIITLGAKETRVILTEKLKRIIEHPDFDRLGSISQLGLINYIYPSARHTRLEHALGTYGDVCEYIRSLWYNKHDPLFKAIMTKYDLYAIMLAALLHDVGYYPLAHELEDCRKWKDSSIKHENYSGTIILNDLADIIKNDWDVDPNYVNDIISGSAISFKGKILQTMISGPIDADKLDYLLRDSMHLGLPYAEGIDKQWFLRNLTLAYDDSISPALAITEKGRVSAESIALVRFHMFSVAYWHHTVRAIKCMLKYATDKLDNQHTFDKNEFFDWFKILPYTTPFKTNEIRKNIHHTDYLQLCWIREKLETEGQNMIDLILKRRLFKRIVVYDSNMDSSSIYQKFLRKEEIDIEKLRIQIEEKLRKHLVDAGHTIVSNLKPLLLIDVPKLNDDVGQLHVVSELGCNPFSQNSVIWNNLVDNFSESVGKVRIFIHPDAQDAYNQSLPPNELKTMVEIIMKNPTNISRK